MFTSDFVPLRSNASSLLRTGVGLESGRPRLGPEGRGRNVVVVQRLVGAPCVL